MPQSHQNFEKIFFAFKIFVEKGGGAFTQFKINFFVNSVIIESFKFLKTEVF